MDVLKRRISEQLDQRRNAELSDDLRREIESSSGDLQSYADDLMKVEHYLMAIREIELPETDLGKVHANIVKGIEEAGMSGTDGKLLDPPMPDGSDDGVSGMGDAPSSEEPGDPPEDEDRPRMRLTATRLKADKKKEDKESSGMLNIGALVQEHRMSMTPASGGSMDLPPMVVGPGASGKPGGSKVVPVVVVLGVIAVVGIAAAVGVTTLGKKDEPNVVAQAPVIDRAALEEELKQKILAELKAEGKMGAEAEQEASRQAQLLAQAEIDKKAQEPSGQDDSEARHASTKKKKKPGDAKEEQPTTAPGTAFTPKTTSSTAGGTKTSPTATPTKPKTAADDLASLLEEAGGGGAKTGVVETPAKTTPAPAPEPASTNTGNLPLKLDKAAIRKAMNKIQPKILQCGKDKIGTIAVNFVVLGSGDVKEAKVQPGPVTSDAAVKSCIQKVAESAKFDPFQATTQSVVYNFVFAPKPGV